MKHILHAILLLVCLIGVSMSSLISTGGKQTLLYHVSNEECLYSIDKLNRISLLNNNNNNELGVETFNDKSSDDSSMPKLYSLLYAHKEYALIGTRHKLINISLENDINSSARVLSWPQSNTKLIKANNKNECLTSKLSSYFCDNYIRTAVPLITTNRNNDDEPLNLITCGTNTSQPYCRKYSLNTSTNEYTLLDEFQNPSILMLNRALSKSNLLPAFSGSKSDAIYFVNLFSQDTTINKQIIENSKFAKLVKTPKYALKNPNFKSSFEHKDKVYFFYSEIDLNDEANGLTFKKPYSLMAEVCADDTGMASYTEIYNRFITFKKALIYCYLPDYRDEFHLKYTDIQAVSQPLKRVNSTNDDVFYAIFTFRRANSVDSALCKYKMTQVESTMKGNFKFTEHQRDAVYNKPFESCAKYKEYQGSIINNYYKEITRNYKFEMEQTINEPALFALTNVKFTSIAIDEARSENNHNEVIFIGTDDGRVLKLITRETNIKSKKYQQPILVQEIRVFDTNKSVTNLIIASKESKLVVISDEEIKSIKLDASCSSYLTCAGCVLAQDPYCAWSLSRAKCSSLKENPDLLSASLDVDITKCYDLSTSTYTGSKLDLALLYSINNKEQEQQQQTTNAYQFDTSLFQKLDSMMISNSKASSSNSSSLVVAIFLTALITCVSSVLFTWLFIKKRYQMAEYVAKHLLQTSVSSSNQSNRSSSSSYNDYPTKQFKKDAKHQKCKNFYEKPSKSDLLAARYAPPDSPITSTTLTESSNQHSPNQLITRSLNSALSSSDDSIEPVVAPANVDTQNRRLIYSSVDSNRLNSDMINITTNLLSRTNDSNI